jgi:hypothetical protein
MAKASRAVWRPIDRIDLDEDNPLASFLKSEGELQRMG